MKSSYTYIEKGRPEMGKDPIQDRRTWNQIIIETIEANIKMGKLDLFVYKEQQTGCCQIPFCLPTCDLSKDPVKERTISCNRCVLQDFFFKAAREGKFNEITIEGEAI